MKGGKIKNFRPRKKKEVKIKNLHEEGKMVWLRNK